MKLFAWSGFGAVGVERGYSFFSDESLLYFNSFRGRASSSLWLQGNPSHQLANSADDCTLCALRRRKRRGGGSLA